MVNYILLYKIRKIVKKLLKDKIEDDELATTPKSCIGCLADEISWEVYYLVKEKGATRRISVATGYRSLVFFSLSLAFRASHQSIRLRTSFSNPRLPGS